MKTFVTADGFNESTPLSFGTKQSIIDGGRMPSVWEDLRRRRTIGTANSTDDAPRDKWMTLLFGQLIALLATAQNAASFTLEYGMGKVFPFFLMLNAYLMMSVHLWFLPSDLQNNASHRIPLTTIPLRAPWWYYVCISMLDVFPNYLTLLSLKNTSLTSSTLLGSLTVPSIMVSCHFLLGKNYRPAHYVGVALCLTAGVVTLWTDLAVYITRSLQSNSHPHSYYGDLLAVAAAILYGVGDAVGEFWCKHVDRKEYLGMLGAYGTLLCSMLVLMTEREALADLFEDKSSLYPALGTIAIYATILVSYYVSSSIFLVYSDATLLDLSMQSSNLWAICFSLFAFQEAPSPLFYFALALEVCGVFVYELFGNKNTVQKRIPLPELRRSRN